MSPDSHPLLAAAAPLLADGAWDGLEDLCRRAGAEGRADAMAYALLGIVFAKRGNVELAHRFLAEAGKPLHGPEGARVAADCIRRFLGPDQAAVLQAGLKRAYPGEGAFAAAGDAPPPDALGAWPYMNEIEVRSVQAALGLLPGPVEALEWGGGHSTFFFARGLPAGSVWSSVEHDAGWFAQLRQVPPHGLGARVDLHLVPNSGPFQDGVDDGDMTSFPEYIRHPRNLGATFRFILVDGRARVECLKEGWTLLGRDGIMALHDAERQEYRPGHPADAYRLEVSNPAVREPKAVCFFMKSAETFRSLSRSLRETLPAHVSLVPGVPGTR